MKEFNLDEALNGKPVKLRNGNKAFICYKLCRDFKYWDGSPINFNICGYILNFNGDIAMLNTAWKEDGKWTMDETKSDRDIIAMWEEPKISIEDLPKPFKPTTQEQYFTITSKYKYEPLYVEETANFNTPIDNNLINQGNAFRTREDAQKWLDFMKGMME